VPAALLGDAVAVVDGCATAVLEDAVVEADGCATAVVEATLVLSSNSVVIPLSMIDNM